MKVPLAGGSPIVLAAGQPGPFGIAVGGGEVFWSSFDGSVGEVALTGGAPVMLGKSLGNSFGVAVDATSVYWVTTSGRVLKVAR